MAAPVSTHDSVSVGEKEVNYEVNGGKDQSCEHHMTVSKQLLYSETYSECYQADRLTVVGKGNKPSRLLKTVDIPQSSVLCRIKSFLPELSVANKKMAQELANNPDSANKFNVEHLDEGEDEHVEMNLSLLPSELLEDEESTSDVSDSESESDSQEEKVSHPKDIKCSLKLHPASSKLEKPGIEIIEDIPLSNNSTEKNVTNR